jgi:acetyltransferase-like isoleucine patch superfamily enzyme
MTLLSRILGFFPLLILTLVGLDLLTICVNPNPVNLVLLPLIIYGLPVACYRIHGHRYPLKEGVSFLVGSDYSPWWGSYQFQRIYISFPALEALLHLIPGAFSLWLKLWGSQIGQDVIWTPGIEISDRGLLQIGNHVVFGYKVSFHCHIIKPKRNNLMLYLRRIKIGDGSFIGAGSRLAAGVEIPPGSYLPILTDLYPNQRYKDAP